MNVQAMGVWSLLALAHMQQVQADTSLPPPPGVPTLMQQVQADTSLPPPLGCRSSNELVKHVDLKCCPGLDLARLQQLLPQGVQLSTDGRLDDIGQQV